MSIPLQTVDYYDNSGGLDLKSSPTKTPEVKSTLVLNMDYTFDGAFLTRNGTSIMNKTLGIPQQMSGAPRTLLISDYKKSDGTDKQIITAGTAIKIDMVTPVDVVTGLDATLPIPDSDFIATGDDEYYLWGNGSDSNLKYDGTTWTNLSLPRPIAPSVVDNGAGTLSAGTYSYYVSYARTVGGVIVQESELSPVFQITLAAGRKTTVTFTACTETVLTGVSQQCNARVLYRSKISDGVIYRLTTILDNTTLVYNDNTADNDLSTIEASFDNQAAPNSKVFEVDDFGQVWYVDADNPTDVYVAKAYRPWNVPTTDFAIFDGPVRCIVRCFGSIIFGTDKSVWVQNGSFAEASPRKITSSFGILNNKCAVGKTYLYVLATNFRVYTITPTDFSQDQMRISESLSDEVDTLFSQVSKSESEMYSMEYYANSENAKVYFSLPIGEITNNKVLVYNEENSIRRNTTCWQYYDNIFASALRQITINGEINIYSGDYNGFLWKLDDSSLNGDGAEENGVVTSATVSTLVDSTANWEVNKFVGVVARIIDGVGAGSSGVIVSNTATEITISSTWGTTPNSASSYTIGGYDVYQFSNWKYLIGSYDTLKQLWFMNINANASGDYTIKAVFQLDFNQSINDQEELLVTLTSGNAIWGAFLWLDAVWGSRSVFQERFRHGGRFRAIRLGFLTREAGKPFQINGFSLSAQDKRQFYRAS